MWGVTVLLSAFHPSFAAEPQITEAVVNAPIAKIWEVFTTAEGYRQLGFARAEVDLRVGGRIRTHEDAGVRLNDSYGEQEILAYDPQRMLAIRRVGDADREALMRTWTVIYFNSIAGETTHVRIVDLGLDDSPASKPIRAQIEQSNRRTLDLLVKRYRPNCAHCERTP